MMVFLIKKGKLIIKKEFEHRTVVMIVAMPQNILVIISQPKKVFEFLPNIDGIQMVSSNYSLQLFYPTQVEKVYGSHIRLLA